MEITICIGSSCHLRGSREIIETMERLIRSHGLEERVELKGSFCMGECTNEGVCVRVGEKKFSLHPADTAQFFAHEVLEVEP